MASDRKEFFVSLDLKTNSLLNFVADPVESVPSNGAKEGQLITSGGKLYIGQSNGSYVELGTAGATSDIKSTLTALSTKVDGIEKTVETAAQDIVGLDGRLDTAEGEIDTLQGKMTAAEGNITTLQTDMGIAKTDISALKTTVGDASSGLVKKVNDNTTEIAKKANADDVYTTGEVDTKVTTLEGKINLKANIADVYDKSSIDTKFAGYYKKTETYSADEIDTKISDASTKAYKIKGSVNKFSELPTSGQVEGDVWNVLEAFSTGDPAKPYPAGTNVVWADGAWDPLGGIVDLSGYALISTVNTLKTTLEESIATKVAQDDYNAKMTAIDAALDTKATIEALNAGLAGKVDTTTYTNDKKALQEAIDSKVAANNAITAGTYPKITFDAKGLVTGGTGLEANDIPEITASKISDFAAKARTAVRYQTTSDSGAIVNVAHNLNVQFPHVVVYNAAKEEIGVHVKVTDSNNITVSGNEDLGAITIVVSA